MELKETTEYFEDMRNDIQSRARETALDLCKEIKRLQAKVERLEDALKESARRFHRMGKSHCEIDSVLSKP